MNFTLQRDKYRELDRAAGLSPLEKAFLASPQESSFKEDEAVETLVDDITSQSCRFRFRKPLAGEFDEARDHALNCLEMGEPHPRRVRHWVGDCLKCMDCLLLVYLRDVLKQAVVVRIGRRPGQVAERDLYLTYKTMPDDDLQKVGKLFNGLYDERNGLEHQVINAAGRAEIRPVPHSRLRQTYQSARDKVKASLGVMVPRYRKAFPRECTDQTSGHESSSA